MVIVENINKFLYYGLTILFIISLGNAAIGAGLVFTVDSELDNNGDCSIIGSCTLRAAISEANNTPGLDAIEFSTTGAILLNESLPTIIDSLEIRGPGSDLLTINAGQTFSAIRIDNTLDITPMVVAITGLTITGGKSFYGGGVYIHGAKVSINGTSIINNRAEHSGGGVYLSDGILKVWQCIIENNNAKFFGGGVCNISDLEVVESTIWKNNADSAGGLINIGGELRLIDSSLIDNYTTGSAPDDGIAGGIFNYRGYVSLTNCTISGNEGRQGGGIVSDGMYPDFGIVSIVNCTIADNLSDEPMGAGIYSDGHSRVVLKNTILDLDDDCYAAIPDAEIKSHGHNIGNSSCNLTTPSDLVGIDPRIGILRDNGGPTHTMALSYNSPAIDAGDDSACPDEDQRGVDRPQDGNGDFSAICDIGAFELKGIPKVIQDDGGGGGG